MSEKWKEAVRFFSYALLILAVALTLLVFYFIPDAGAEKDTLLEAEKLSTLSIITIMCYIAAAVARYFAKGG